MDNSLIKIMNEWWKNLVVVVVVAVDKWFN